MMSTAPAIVNLPIAAHYLFMTQKKEPETIKAMQAKLEGHLRKTRQQSNPFVRIILSKHRD